MLFRSFDPNKHVFEFAPLQGNIGYIQDSMERLEADRMAMVGMSNPADTMNPEVMKDGNSGYKLQLAMGPNQLVQDDTVKNCAIGLSDLIYITWRTMVQYADDYNIQQLANTCAKGMPFMDAESIKNFEFIDRRLINVDLALGFLSEENRLTRQQLILQTQVQFAQAMAQVPPEVPEMFAKVRRPYEDTLRVLGVKDVDAYLPTLEEAAKIIQAQAAKGPSPEQQETQSKADLNKAKVQETGANTLLIQKKAEDIDMDNMFEMMAAKKGNLKAVQID